MFQRSIKDLWLGDSDDTYSGSAFWKNCPNAAELGLVAKDADMNAYDINTTDMNATAEADAALEAADEATNNAANAVANAQAAIRESGDEETEPTSDQPSYYVNNDAGE